jgi:methylated-DNA-[protein]-cysteine S-methyltransferase
MKDLRIAWTEDLEAASRRATTGLEARARRAGLLDVGYAVVDSPVGSLLVAVTRNGLVRLEYPGDSLDHMLEDLADRVSPRLLESAAMTDQVRRQLDAYFEGRLRVFRTRIDWTLVGPGFFRRVLEATARIPFGAVSTYGTIAKVAGSPRAARAAGNALHDNPVPIVVPCHRVVPSSGGIGKYGGDEWRKAFLLRLEGAVAPPD